MTMFSSEAMPNATRWLRESCETVVIRAARLPSSGRMRRCAQRKPRPVELGNHSDGDGVEMERFRQRARHDEIDIQVAPERVPLQNEGIERHSDFAGIAGHA